ncbi:MlaD family protein [Actinomadura atramentaria]|uniref:MlaD family protein n=1 Tax=Actinomadura atramentaria TaxID=1990 RepID=UPI0003796AE8|nr:MCE family protein [Actinomadura atramentaria]
MHTSRTPALVGVTTLVLVAALLGWLARPHHDGRRYRAVFDRAGQGLDAGRSDVKVRGVAVGRVESVRLLPDGRVAVRFRATVAVPASARASIEPVSVFGPKDLVLDLGSGPALPEGATVAAAGPPLEPADIADPAYELTRAIDPDDVAAVLHALSAGLSGEGPALRRALDHGAAVVAATDRRRDDLAAIVGDLADVGATLGERGARITGAVGDLDRLAPVVHGRPDRVSALLDEAARFAATTAGTLDRQGGHLGSIIDSAAPAVGVLAAQAPRIGRLIDVLDGFFHGLASMINTPGPSGTLLGQGLNTLSLDPCSIFIDVC